MISHFFVFVNTIFKVLHTFFYFSHYIFMKNSVGKGAIILIISGLIGKIFGALFRLPLTNILGIKGIGGYQMVMSLYSLTLGFVSSGVTNALSKLISSARARGDYNKLSGYYRYALLFSMGLSLLFGIIFAVLSNQISSFQGFSEGNISYMLLAILLPLGALIGIFRGIVQGYENMTPTAISQLIEQVVKFAFGLFFAYILGKDNIGAGVFGAFLGIIISEIFATVYLAFIITRKVKIKTYKINVKKEFFSAVLPLTFSTSILPLSFAFESIIISSLLAKAGFTNDVATTLYGLQSGVVGAILHFPLIISLSVAMAMLPKISFLSAKGDYIGQQKIIGKSFNIMWFFLVPLVVGIIALSRQLYPIIYPSIVNGYLDIACQLTILGGFSIVLSAIMQLLNTLLQAKGYYNQSLLFNLVGGIFKVLSLFIFAPIENINIFAIPISNIVLYSIICICALIKLGSLVKIGFYGLALPFVSSIIMYMTISIVLSFLTNIWGLFVATILGGVCYLILCMPLLLEYSKEIFSRLKKKLN